MQHSAQKSELQSAEEPQPRVDFEGIRKYSELLPIPSFLLTCDADETFRFYSVNAAHSLATGLTTDAIQGKTPHDLLPVRAAETLLFNYRRCLELDDTHSYEEVLRFSNSVAWWFTTLQPLREGKKIVGLMGLAKDITNRKVLEESYASALTELEQSSADLRTIMSMTAHDLRGPIRQSLLINELIQDGFKDMGDGKRMLLENGRDVLKKALNLIDDKLSTARQQRRSAANHEEIDIEHLARDIMALVDPLSRLRFSCTAEPIMGEKFVIDIVLRNLLDNAVRYARSQVEVDVITEQDKVQIIVHDDGPGLDDDWQAILLRIEDSQHSGFGLSESVKLVAARDGSLTPLPDPKLGGASLKMEFPNFQASQPASNPADI